MIGKLVAAEAQVPMPFGFLNKATASGAINWGGAPAPDSAWIFSEGSGTGVANAIAGQPAMTLSNAGMWTTGKSGSGILGNGTYSAQVAAFSHGSPGRPITICWWQKKTAAYVATEILFELGAAYDSSPVRWVVFNDSSTLYCGLYDGGYFVKNLALAGSGLNAAIGSWVHMAIVMDPGAANGGDSNTVKFYVDGTLATAVTTSSNGDSNSTGFSNGLTLNVLSRNGSTAQVNNIVLDDIRVFLNRALTGPEINATKNDPK